MALTRITKGVIKPNENYDTHDINSTGIITATGANITGNMTVGGVLTYEDVTSIDSVGLVTARDGIFLPDDKTIRLGNTAASPDLKIFHQSSDQTSRIQHTGNSTPLFLQSTNEVRIEPVGLFQVRNQSSHEKYILATNDGSVDLYFNGNKKLETSNTGVTVTGTVVATGADINGDIDVDGHTNLDNVSIAGVSTFTGEIDHNSTLTTVKLKVNSTNAQIDLTSGQNSFTRYGAINHYHNNSTSTIHNQIKLAPRNGGTGRIMFYNLGGGSLTEKFRIDGTDGVQTLNDTNLSVAGDTTLIGDLDVDGHTNLDNVNIVGVTTVAGDILPATTATYNLGTNNAGGIGNGRFNNAYFKSSVWILDSSSGFILGDSMDTKFYHDGNNTKIDHSGTGSFGIRSNNGINFSCSASAGETAMQIIKDGGIKLYHNFSGTTSSTLRFETTGQGINVIGHSELDNVNISGVTTTAGISYHSSSLQMLNGNNIVLQNDANSANCQIDCYGGAGFRLTSYNQTMFTCENGGNTKFYTNSGTTRLEITNGGDVLVNTGTLHIPDTLTHSGDTNTKIRFPSADTISFETGGAERLRITSAGHIGFNRSNVDINDNSSQQAVAEPSRFVFNNNYSNNYTDASLKLYLFMYGATRQGFTSGPNYDLQYHSSGSATQAKHSFFTQNVERLRITATGFIGINEDNPETGLTIAKLGDYSTNDGNTYYMPVGKWSSAWNGMNVIQDSTDYWVGFVGGYLKSSSSVNISLAPNRSNTSQQAGMYISGEATGNSSADFTLGKIVGGSATGQGTSGNVRATKSELLRIKPSGNLSLGNTHAAKKVHISTTGNQKILIDPNYNNNSGGSSNSEANANNIVESILIRSSFGDSAHNTSNAGHKWGIKFQGYNGNDFTQATAKCAGVFAVSEDEAGGYNRNVGLTFHTSPYNTAHREVMRINTNGIVTKPYQYVFTVTTTNHQKSANWSKITDHSIYSSQCTGVSDGTNWSNSTQRFTAPVAGVYHFFVGGWSYGNSNGSRYAYSFRHTNGNNLTFIGGGDYCSGDSPMVGWSRTIKLAKDEWVELWGYSAIAVRWGGGHVFFWGGYLLG